MHTDCLTSGNLWLRVAGAGAARRGHQIPLTFTDRQPVPTTTSSAQRNVDAPEDFAERSHR